MDKFGDSGLVGVCILKYAEQKAVIDTLLLSCRVLGRGVEDVFVIQALKLAKQRGCEGLLVSFIQPQKTRRLKISFRNKGLSRFPHPPRKQKDATFFP